MVEYYYLLRILLARAGLIVLQKFNSFYFINSKISIIIYYLCLKKNQTSNIYITKTVHVYNCVNILKRKLSQILNILKNTFIKMVLVG